MTDARIPDRWLNDRRFRRLTDGQYRSYVQLLLWSVSNRTDGVVDAFDLDFVPNFLADHVAQLELVGLIETTEEAVVITDFPHTQTQRNELELLDRKRRADREKKARQRSRSKPDEPSGKRSEPAPVETWETVSIPADDEPF